MARKKCNLHPSEIKNRDCCYRNQYGDCDAHDEQYTYCQRLSKKNFL